MLEPLAELQRDHEVLVLFYNPNIAPRDEHERRLTTLADYAASVGMQVEFLESDNAEWLAATAIAAGDPERRCMACYELRLGAAAREAAARGIGVFTTTLTVSPYQRHALIARAGEEAGRREGVTYLHVDFRERYGEATRRARELNLYRQSYCGCLPSAAEAEDDRARRREERRRARESG